MGLTATEGTPQPLVPLSRNRNYNILWTSQLLSELVVEVAAVAFPLLILARSGSVLQMGLAASAMAAASMVAIVPAGVAADRWDRRKVMVWCQVLRCLGMVSLVVALALDWYDFRHILLVMVVEGVLGTVFDPVEHAALPQVVPESQLSRAVSRNLARPFVATLVGPVTAGFLFEIGVMNPFLANVLMLGCASVTLLLLRLPRRTGDADPESTGESRSWRTDTVEGIRWVWSQPVIRVTLVWVVLTNLVFSSLLIIIIAESHGSQVASTEIGLMMACLGGGGLLGALVAGRAHDALPGSVIILGFSWTVAAATAGMAMVPAGLPLGLLLATAAFLAPVANTTVLTYQMLVTPDEVRGRLSGIVGFCSGAAGMLGPAAGGFLLSFTGQGTAALWWCSGLLTFVAVATTLHPVFRRFPRSQP